jgi:cyclic beta-1,2-glucan synthetase
VVKERHGLPVRLRLIATILVVLGVARVSVAEDVPSIRLAEAPRRGAFNVGDAQANVTAVTDPAAGEVLKFDYRIPKGTAAGVWTKRFPASLKPEGIDIVRMAVKTGDPEQARQVAATLEIKGNAGIQRIPLELHPDWSYHEQFVDWKAIGRLSEVVVSVTRIGDGEIATGTFSLDIRFEKLSALRKISTSQVARLGGVVVVAMLTALVMGLLGKLSGDSRQPLRTEGMVGLRRDIVEGFGTVAILGLAAGIYALGSLGPLEVGWLPLVLAVAGVVLGEWWKFGLTGKHLSAGEAFRDALATGLMAASASPLAILQAPANWSKLLLLSQPVAAVFVFLYHAANARSLTSTGKHLGDIGLMMVATPYVIGGLLLLESGDLVLKLGDILTLGTLAAQPDLAGYVGRVFVLFLFNEVVANALGWASKRTLLRSSRAHFWLLIVAAVAVAGPWIAGFGSGATVAKWPGVIRFIAVVTTTVLSQAGLWAEAYLLTGFIIDAMHGNAPSLATSSGYPLQGAKKGIVFSGTFMGGLNLLALIASVPGLSQFAAEYPWAACAVLGTLSFPLLKTVVETFDGSQAFFRRVSNSYRNPILYARGAVVGLGLGLGITWALAESSMAARIWFGLGVGVAAFAGVNLIQDALAARAGHGRIQSWRVYFVQGLLGGFIGAAIGFYLDATQVQVVIDKYHRYVDPGQSPRPFEQNALISKWGLIRLGTESGGPSLIFVEALLGVIVWSVPSWLFAINRTFMAAYFDKDTTPIRALFTRAGLVQLVENMIGVLRWGLWMSPIINSFLRPMGEPTWYNQDGAIRTVIATVHDVTSSRDEFRAWSLNVFIAMLVYDWLRIAIWLDHMGLRVATLVNLSFLGMDKLDRRLARFLAPAATARCIPEGVKRFTTWAPLLIPYYIPRGADWDYAWGKYQSISGSMHGDLLATIAALPRSEQLLLLAGSLAASTAAFSGVRWLRERSGARLKPALTLSNPEYEVTLRPNGEIFSRVKARDYDVSRRSYDLLDPAGRTVFLVEMTGESPSHAWPLIGNVPAELAESSWLERDEETFKIINTAYGIRATINISLPEDATELWTITLENSTDSARHLKVVPYLEWVLNKAEADRGHTQYNRLFAEVEYAHGLHAVLAWDKHAKALGLLASDVAPEGFLSSRMDFIGRARSIWKPRVVETLAFTAARDTDSHPTFDPIGSLLLSVTVPARGSTQLKLLIGLVADKRQAIDLIARQLQIPLASAVPDARRRKAAHSIGHGEIPPGTPEPYTEFSEDGQGLLVRTPFTTRPFDHTLSNALGHVVVVTNRGLHTTSSVNSQQNRVTPDWSDTVTREVPSEAFYLYDPTQSEWFSPTFQPLNDAGATYETEFSVDGSATFRMTKGTIETELTVFVPPDEPAGVYRLTIRNHGNIARCLRVAPYFQIVLAGQPEFSGPLQIRHDPALNALFFTNPRNTYRTGPAFVSLSIESTHAETTRGRFFGTGQSLAHPYLVLHGAAFPEPTTDDRPVAAFLAELEIPAGG